MLQILNKTHIEGFSKITPMRRTELVQVCKDYGIFNENKTVVQLKKIYKEFRNKQENERKENTEKSLKERIQRRLDPNRPIFIPAQDTPIQRGFTKLINTMKEHPEQMQRCYFEMQKINKKYPSRKNENKMVFGKLAERAFYHSCIQMGVECIDLDKLCQVGSEYRNDFKIDGFNISQKTTKNQKGDIIMINTFSTLEHDLKIDLLLCVIETGKIYFIPHDIVDELEYVDYKPGRIVYKNTIKKYMEDRYSHFVYSFPPLSEAHLQEIQSMEEVDLISILYEMI